MMKTTRFFRGCVPPLAGVALLLAAGCEAPQPGAGAAAGAGPGAQRTGDTPAPDTNGPHPIYIINDPLDPGEVPDSPNPLNGVKPGLIVNLQPPKECQGVGYGVVDAYDVPEATGQQSRTNGPHPAIIQINLPPETAPPNTRNGASALNGPRIVVVMMDKPGATPSTQHTIIPEAGKRRMIVVYLHLPLQYDPKSAPTPSPAAKTTAAGGTLSGHRSRAR